jgi:hypothetical protein
MSLWNCNLSTGKVSIGIGISKRIPRPQIPKYDRSPENNQNNERNITNMKLFIAGLVSLSLAIVQVSFLFARCLIIFFNFFF